MDGLEFLKEYRNNKGSYLPMIDYEEMVFPARNEFGDVNIGWNCGVIGNRPYFAECWASEGITVLTIFISTVGIGDASVEDIERLLIDEGGIYSKKEGYNSPWPIPKIVDSNGNEFYSVNIGVGVEDEPAYIDGGKVYPFAILNEYNIER